MEEAEFIEEIRSLEAFFEKELSIEQMKDWYAELKEYPVSKVRMAIRECKRNCKFLPKLAEFLNIISEVKMQQVEKEKIPCKKCDGTGYIVYIKKVLNGKSIIPYTYTAVCNCGNAQRYDGTEIKNSEHRSKFYTELESNLDKNQYKEIYSKQDKNVFLYFEQNLWR